MTNLKIGLCGTGNVGSAFIESIVSSESLINQNYGLNISNRQIGFSVFKNATENATYKICKNFKPDNKNLTYLITDSRGKILKNSHDLVILIKNTNWKKL